MNNWPATTGSVPRPPTICRDEAIPVLGALTPLLRGALLAAKTAGHR
jgi:hypothetical protein